MSEINPNGPQRFHYGDVNFDDPDSVSLVYGSGGGLWRREEVTLVKSYFFPDLFEKRSVKDGNPECGQVIEWHFHDPERQAEVAKAAADKRHWLLSGRYGFGKFFLERGGSLNNEDGSLLKWNENKQTVFIAADGTQTDFSRMPSDDLHFDYFMRTSGALWLQGGFCEFHAALSRVQAPPELAAAWKERYTTGGAEALIGLRCYLSRVDVEVDEKAKEAGEKRIAETKKQMEAEGRPQADIDRLRWFPPTRIFIDEIVGFEDVDSLAAYDPNAVVITPRAIEFIKAKIESGVVKMADIGMQALNENADIHPEVVAALDVSVLAQHGITWANQRLSLAG